MRAAARLRGRPPGAARALRAAVRPPGAVRARLRRAARATLFAAALLLALAAPAGAAPTTILLGTFSQPTWAGAPASEPSRVFVTERGGQMWVISDGVKRVFLDLRNRVESAASERGLLSAAFGPDYADTGRFYVYYTAREPLGTIEVWEFRRSADPDVADPDSGRRLVSAPHPDAANHNGGQVQVGPDGRLWLATGDGGGGNNQYGHAQDPASRLGKLLSADRATGDVRIEAQGLRNPWRFSFAPDGRIVIGDVGQGQWEELNVGLAGNYGWPCKEGFAEYRPEPGCAGVPLHDPLLVRGHGTPFHCSIVAGYVVRDPGLPTLFGRHIYGDYCAAPLRSVALSDASTDAEVGLSVQALSSFGEDACGRVLVVSLNGPVYRLVDGAATPCPAGEPTPTATPTPTPTASPTPAATAPATPRATATPPATPAPPAAPSPAADTTPPRCAVSVRITGLRSLGRRHFLSVALRTDRPCRATLTGRVRGVTGFRATSVRLVPGTRRVVRLRVRDRRAITRALRTRARTILVRVEADGRSSTRRERARP